MRAHLQTHENGTKSLLFECPGCDAPHVAYVGGTERPNWQWNGDEALPTLSPSVLVTWEQFGVPQRCHSFVRKGRIEYLADCTHALAGQTVDLPEWGE